jgi:hypothetical protein
MLNYRLVCVGEIEISRFEIAIFVGQITMYVASWLRPILRNRPWGKPCGKPKQSQFEDGSNPTHLLASHSPRHLGIPTDIPIIARYSNISPKTQLFQ